MERKNETKERSLFWRAIALVLLLILVPAMLSVGYIVTELSTELRRSAQESADFYSAQLIEKNSSAMEMLRSSVESLLGNREVRAIMAQDGAPLTGTQHAKLQNTLDSATLYNVAWTDQYIDSLYLFYGEDTLITSARDSLLPSELLEIRSLYERYADFSSFGDLVKPAGEKDSAYYIVDYTDVSTMIVCGKIIIKVNTGRMIPAEPIQAIYPGAEVLFTTDDGVLLSAKSQTEDPKLEQRLRELDAGEQETGYVTWRGRSCYHIRQPLRRYRLQLDIFIPESEIVRAGRTTVAWYLVFLSAVVLGTLFAALALGRRMMRPVQHSISTIEHMADGDLTVRMQRTEYTEVNTLVSSFNRMAENLEQLYEDAYTKGMLLRESEYKVLEAQINPHFIFNVLETVNMQCLAAGQKQTSTMVTDLAALLRASIARDGKQKVTLREELEYARYYLDIQKARFSDELCYEISYTDESVLDCYLPKLTIQPLVENSVVHGLEKKRGGGKVTVQIWEEDDSVYIRIADDGAGFLLGELTDQDSSRHNHIALTNIQRRLALLYGAESTFRINSSPGVGTVVLIIIPAEQKGD